MHVFILEGSVVLVFTFIKITPFFAPLSLYLLPLKTNFNILGCNIKAVNLCGYINVP